MDMIRVLDLEATVDKTFVVELLEDPPDALHERRIHRLVVVLKVNPTTQTSYVLLQIHRNSPGSEHISQQNCTMIIEVKTIHFMSKQRAQFKISKQAALSSQVSRGLTTDSTLYRSFREQFLQAR